MTEKTFEKGYKLLKRYFKEINRYPEFIRITTQNNPSYKKILKRNFNVHRRTWYEFFTYTWFVGDNYQLYNDHCLNKLREGWHKFLQEHEI